jgi:hypothetical protein
MSQVVLFSWALYHAFNSRHQRALICAALGLFETAFDCRHYGVLAVVLPALLGLVAIALAVFVVRTVDPCPASAPHSTV